MQDYNYLHTNSFELTLELGCDKFPADKRLKTFWDDNKPALIAFMEMVGNHRNPGPKKDIHRFNGTILFLPIVLYVYDFLQSADGTYDVTPMFILIY